MNLLGAANYDPAIAVSKATSALLAMTAIDTTNLRLAITVPSSGIVLFRLKCAVTGAATLPEILLGIMHGVTILGRQVPQQVSGTQSVAWAEFIVSGLTPGAMNVDAAYGVQSAVALTSISYGGPDDASGNDAWGGFVFEAWDPIEEPTTLVPVYDPAKTAAQPGDNMGSVTSVIAPVNVLLPSQPGRRA